MGDVAQVVLYFLLLSFGYSIFLKTIKFVLTYQQAKLSALVLINTNQPPTDTNKPPTNTNKPPTNGGGFRVVKPKDLGIIDN